MLETEKRVPPIVREPSRHRRPALWVVVVAAVAILALVAGQALSNRGTNELNRALANASAEARSAASRIDMQALTPLPGTHTFPGSTRLVGTAVPLIAGAGKPTYTVIAGPPLQVLVDYPVTAQGLHGCVRIVRTGTSVVVRSDARPCDRAFRYPGQV